MSRLAFCDQAQGELWARLGGLASVREQGGRDRLAVDDRVAPFVELDSLGQQLGAQAVAAAGDGIHADARHAAAVVKASGTDSVSGRAHARQRPRCACSANSTGKTSSAL